MGSHSLAFKAWVKDEVIYCETPIDRFNNMTIGIDAEDYLHSILSPGNQAPEPLLPAHGGNGFTIKKRIDEDLERLRGAGIRPWFVFNGLDLASKDRASVLNESRKATTILDEAWTIYDKGEGENAVIAFGKACTYRTYHILRSLMFHLHSQGVLVQVAPYTAAAHLQYLLQSNNVDAVQGSASCLLYGIEQVIIDYDWGTKKVQWIRLTNCHNKLELTPDQFTAVCLISGSSILPALPELDRDDVKPKIVAATRMLKSFGGDINALLRTQQNEHLVDYHRAQFAVKHPLIFRENGKIEPKDLDKSPSDYHEYVGQRLPPELYEYMCRGLVGPRILNWRTRGELLETPPLDGGNSSTYRDLVSAKLKPIRTQTIGLTTAMLHRYFQKTDINQICWFNEQQKVPLSITDGPDYQKNADTWHAEGKSKPKVDAGDLLGSGLMYAVFCLSDEAKAKKTVSPRKKDSKAPLRDFEDVRANIVWRFLHDRGYLNKDHTLSAWGKALQAAFDQAASDGTMISQESKSEMEEAIFLAIELIRLDCLGTQMMFPAPPYSGGMGRGTDKDKSNAMLISRIACLGTVEHDKIGYTGPLSRSLLAYHQVAAVVRGALRDLIETHAGYMFMSGSVRRVWNNPMYTNLAASLPFVEEPDLGLGLVVKSYLDELSATNGADIEAWFHHVHNIDRNLRKAWSMWDAINAGVQGAADTIVDTNTKTTFKNADTWLKSKLEHAPEYKSEPNGSA